MQYVAPPLLAVGGFIVGGPGGAAIGWTVGSVLFPMTPKSRPPTPASAPSWNQALRGTTIPVTFGTNRVPGHIVWTKNFTPIRQAQAASGKGGGSGGGESKAGGGQYSYTYQADFLFNFGMAPQPIYFGRMWVGGSKMTAQDLVTLGGAEMTYVSGIRTYYKPKVVHGSYSRGTAKSTGTSSAWAYFTAQEGVTVSWPHTAWYGFQALQEGSSPSVPQLTVEIGPSNAASYDVAPPQIVREIMCNSAFGLGIAPTKIVTSTYSSAYTFCSSQGILVSATFAQPESVVSVFEDIFSLYGGYLVESGGKIKFGFISSADVSVRTLDNSHFLSQEGKPPVQVERAAIQDGYNRVRLTYSDRGLEYKQNTIEVADEVDADLRGPRVQEWPSRFVMASSLASTLAERALWANLYGRDVYKFSTGVKDVDLEPGDVVTLVDSSDPDLYRGIEVRIVDQKMSGRLRFDNTAVRHIPYHYVSARTYADPSSISAPSSVDIESPQAFHMYELPREFQGAEAKAFVGYFNQSAIMGAQLHISFDGSNFTVVDDQQPYNVWGIFGTSLPGASALRYSTYSEKKTPLYFFPNTPTAFSYSTPTYCQSYVPDDVTQMGRALGLGTIYVPQGQHGEVMAMQGLSLVGQNNYTVDKLYRGWGTSSLLTINTGTQFTQHGDGTLSYIINPDTIGQIIHYKVVPYDFSGVPYDISSITARTYQIRGEFWQPRDITNIYLFAQSPSIFTNSQRLVDMNDDCGVVQVVSGGCGLRIRWPQVSRDTGFGTGGFGAQDFGSFTADYDPVSYIVKFTQDSGGTESVNYYTIVTTNAYNLDRDTWINSALGFNANAGISTTLVRVQAVNRFSNQNANATLTRGFKKKVTFVWSLAGGGGGGVSSGGGFTPITSVYAVGSYAPTIPAGASYLTARVYGGGGGGNDDGSGHGGGAGAGGKARREWTLVGGDAGATLHLRVASGGIAGAGDPEDFSGDRGATSTLSVSIGAVPYFLQGFGGFNGTNLNDNGSGGDASGGQSNTTGANGSGGEGAPGTDGYGGGGNGAGYLGGSGQNGYDGAIVLEYS